MDNPYKASPLDSRAADHKMPAVIIWYNVYCILLMLVYLSVGVGFVFIYLYADFMADGSETTPAELRIHSVIMVVVSVICVFLYAAGLIFQRGTGGWIFGIVLIGLTLTSACCLPMGGPLMYFWVKPEAKAYLQSK